MSVGGRRFSSLRFRLVAIVCAVLIPLNLTVIALSVVAVRNLRGAALEVCSGELQALADGAAGDLELIETGVRELRLDRRAEIIDLASGTARRNELYLLWSGLSSIRESCRYIDAGYVSCEKTLMTYDSERISLEEITSLRDGVARLDLEALPDGEFYLLTLGARAYLLWNISLGGFSCGFVLRAERLLDEMSALALSGEADALLGPDGETLAITGEPPRNGARIRLPLSGGGFSLQRTAPRSELGAASEANTILLALLIFFTVMFAPFAWTLLRAEVLDPLSALRRGLEELRGGALDYRLPEKCATSDFTYLNKSFNGMASEIQSLRIEAYEKQIENLQTEAALLRLQVNPHLLLNSLNMVYSLAETQDYRKIQEYTLHLVNYFRFALKVTNNVIPISAELRFAYDYLAVQRIRFPGKLEGSCEVDNGVEDALIPPMLIQGLVENSIKHGRTAGNVLHCLIRVRREGERAVVEVEDDGAGMSPETLALLRGGGIPEDANGKHIGLWNARQRLRLFYGESAEMSFDVPPAGGVRVTVAVPLRIAEIWNEE